MKNNVVIGVTGALASGKTTVADMFAEKGALKIDADKIARELLENDKHIRQMVIDAFGNAILTGADIDRRKLAGRVFFSSADLDKLRRILHPPVIEKIKASVAASGTREIVIDAPLLIESGLNEIADVIVVLKASRETQISRATDRGISEEEAENIIANQMPLTEKLKFADNIIDDDENSVEKLDEIKKGVDEIWKKVQRTVH